MTFRYARHTDNLKPIIRFYTEVLGLEILGHFENHSRYNGVMLGHPGLNWHLEFTESDQPARHQPDADDLLVFYLGSTEEINAIKTDARRFEGEFTQPNNPYWQIHGTEIRDPDGFGVMLTLQHEPLDSDDVLTRQIRALGIGTWDELLQYVRALPYGRNATRTDFSLVLTEGKGTCSTKHALLKQVADCNGITNIKLIVGLYRMTAANTKGIGNLLSDHKLDYLPEAHCYLQRNGKRIDVMTPISAIGQIAGDLIEEIGIMPEQVGEFKVTLHQKFLEQWRLEHEPGRTFEEIWTIREQCIQALSRPETRFEDNTASGQNNTR